MLKQTNYKENNAIVNTIFKIKLLQKHATLPKVKTQ